MDGKIKILNFTPEEIQRILEDMGEASYKGKQFCKWVYEKAVTDAEKMTDLSLGMRNLIENRFDICLVRASDEKISADGSIKLLCILKDGEAVEIVLIRHPGRNTLCLSTQAGCRYGCSFCASARSGFSRNLDVGEIISQVLIAKQRFPGGRLNNIVYMGVGEPLDNFENVVKSLGIISSEKGFNIGQRKITVSTCGVAPRIIDFADLGKQYELSVSLHAATDETRNRLMPVNKIYPLKELLKACEYFYNRTKREVTFEYVLLKGVNDSGKDAESLIKLNRGFKSKVNIIPYNAAMCSEFMPPDKEAVSSFCDRLSDAGLKVTVRWSKGSDINAACGQLRFLRKNDKARQGVE
ncbi:MAG: 23S rRNA (adenine(2503)-C(2))-methyltransferase RlmN [Candidatus Aureabacteria bacterium]|nr:23S rRNA (adenine(2503)-C(2))-methyltransferase RlmN [Candidatus Auribacterota bacterium]